MSIFPGGAAVSPLYNGPPRPWEGFLNIGNQGAMGLGLQLLAAPLMQQLMGPGRMQSQFFPQQNLYDQITANQFYMQQQEASMLGGMRDQQQMTRFIAGTMQLQTAGSLQPHQEARAEMMGAQLQKAMPMLSMLLGPDLIDQLHGERGSAAVMAQFMHTAMRSAIDPVTGGIGFSGRSAGIATQSVFERLYGDPTSLNAMKGVSAGQAGQLVEQLQQRGLMGGALGARSFRERLGDVVSAGKMATGDIERIADQLKESMPDSTPEERRDTVRASHAAITKSAGDPKFTSTQLTALAGGEDILRTADAARIADRIKNMTGAVAAMRDIFGDMGRPNAPMQELVAALDALTQGGLGTMAPGKLEEIVRRTHVIARESGMGMQSMIALQSQGAALADRLGLDRRWTMGISNQAALYGAALGDVGLDKPFWESRSRDQSTLLNQQLTANFVASPVGNQLAALMRMSEQGMLGKTRGRTANMIDAIKRGKFTTDMYQDQGKFIEMVAGESEISSDAVREVLNQRYSNQEFGQEFNIERLRGGAQLQEAIARGGRYFGDSLNNQLLNNEGLQRAAGGRTELEGRLNALGVIAADKYFNLDPEKLSPADRRAALRKFLVDEGGIKQAFGQNADVNAIVSAIGGDPGMNAMLGVMFGSATQAIQDDPAMRGYENITEFNRQVNPHIQAQRVRRAREAESIMGIQSSMSGLASMGPIRRLMEAVSNATPGTDIESIFQDVLGGIETVDAARRDPVIKYMLKGVASTKDAEHYKDGELTDAGTAHREEINRRLALLLGSREGAQEELARLDSVKFDPKDDYYIAVLNAVNEPASLVQRQRKQKIPMKVDALRDEFIAFADDEDVSKLAGNEEFANALVGRMGTLRNAMTSAKALREYAKKRKFASVKEMLSSKDLTKDDEKVIEAARKAGGVTLSDKIDESGTKISDFIDYAKGLDVSPRQAESKDPVSVKLSDGTVIKITGDLNLKQDGKATATGTGQFGTDHTTIVPDHG